MIKKIQWLTLGVTLIGLHSFANCKIYDLTHSFNNKSLIWPSTNTGFRIYQTLNDTGSNTWIFGESYEGHTHAGTHMDSPRHMVKNKWTVDQIPSDHLVNVPAIVIDIRNKTSRNRDYEADENDINAWIHRYGSIPDNAVVIFNTGWSEYYNDAEKYFGNKDLNVLDLHFPGIKPSAAKWLVENNKLVGVGLDTPSPDYGQAQIYKSHVTFFHRNIYVLENLKGLDQLPAKGLKLQIMPMKIEGGSGAPCRIFAEVLTSAANFNNFSNIFKFLIILILNFH